MNRRQINLKFVLALMVSVGVLATAVYFVHAYQVEREAGILLQRAERAAEENKIDQAIGYLERYLGFVPSDNDALARFGDLLMTEGIRIKSPRLRRRGYRSPGASVAPAAHWPAGCEVAWHRRRQVDLSLNVGDRTAAVAHAKALLENNLAWADEERALNDSERAELEFRIGQAEEGRKQYTVATEWYVRATEHAPAQLASFLRLATVWRFNLDAPDKADQLLEGMIDRIARSDTVENKEDVLFQAYLALRATASVSSPVRSASGRPT